MRQKSEKSAEKWSFEITNQHFCHIHTAKPTYYPQSVISSYNAHVHAHNTRASYSFFVFLLSQVSQQPQKHIFIFRETTRRLW